MRWHKWEIKKSVPRIIFSKADFGTGAAVSFTTVAILIGSFIGASEEPMTPLLALAGWAFFTLFFGLILLMLVVPGWLILEASTQHQDKVCLKCHHVSLAGSQYESRVSNPHKAKIRALASVKRQKEKAANSVFENRKEMWKKAN